MQTPASDKSDLYIRKPINYIILLALLSLTISLIPTTEAFANPPAQTQITTPGQLIEAVNSLRLSYGLPPLATHPILMQTAQSQADYMAATGQVTHSRPGGITFTQQLLSLGFPLSGDLSLGGFRAENILSSNGPLTWDGVPPGWQDEQHMNTMLSQNYTHIGAGVSQGADGYFYAVDTAAATGSGQMQSSASAILTSVPGGSDAAAGVSQYMVPVAMSTARPDGDVLHKVQYGQTLWSIAITYGTTIRNIQALNNLGEDLVVYQGQLLLVKKAATQPAPLVPTLTAMPKLTATPVLTTVTGPASTISAMSFPTDLYPTSISEVDVEIAELPSTPVSSQFLVVLLILAAFIGAGVAVWLIRDPN